MAVDFPETVFVAGTDTGVGKTLVCAVLVAGLNAEYWKPVQSGAEAGTDTEWIRSKTGLPEARFHREAYLLKHYLSPHAAAAREDVRIGLSAINPPARRSAGHLIIEGAGGIMVPLNEKETMADLMQRMNAPVLLVARSTLGTINHTLLSLEKLRRMKLEILGVVMNGPADPENRSAIESFGKIRVIGEMAPMADITFSRLVEAFNRSFGDGPIDSGDR